MNDSPEKATLSRRFRGFLPVVVDVETAGFNSKTDALLEVAAVLLDMNDDGKLHISESHSVHVEPFKGAKLDEAALAFNGIDPYHPFRMAKAEPEALEAIFKPVRKAVKHHRCTRAVLVGHNAFFDLGFINAAVARTKVKSPFHAFTGFDTATLGALAYGQTVLARAAQAAGIPWDEKEAHSAIYDAERTAELFCEIVNKWHEMAGFHPQVRGKGE